MSAITLPSASAHPWTRLLQKVGAEMVGTFFLVFAGCGAVMVDATSGGTIGHIGIGLVFGLVIAVMIYATGHISGAHFNPAVTLAFAVNGQLPWRQVPAYVAGQFAAAALASMALLAVFGDVGGMGATTPSGPPLQSLVLETILSFVLMFVITAVATDGRAVGQMAGLAIGGTVGIAAIFGGPISGASMNPARTLGPALASGEFAGLWIYFVGPVIGALAGAFVYRLVRCADPPRPAAGGCC